MSISSVFGRVYGLNMRSNVAPKKEREIDRERVSEREENFKFDIYIRI